MTDGPNDAAADPPAGRYIGRQWVDEADVHWCSHCTQACTQDDGYSSCCNEPAMMHRSEAIEIATAPPTRSRPGHADHDLDIDELHRYRQRLAEIAAAPVAQRERLRGGQTAVTELVTTTDGRKIVRKSAPLLADPDDTRFYMDGEVLASLVADAVGAPIARVYRASPEADEVWVEHIDGTPMDRTYGTSSDRQWTESVTETGPDGHTPEEIRIGLVDAITFNHDRLGGLIVRNGFQAGLLTGFDGGGSWLDVELAHGGKPALYLREDSAPMRHWVKGTTWREDPPLSAVDLDQIRRQVQALRPEFEAAGRGAWLTQTLLALDAIIRRAQQHERQGHRW